MRDSASKLERKTEVPTLTPSRVHTAFQAGPAPDRIIFHQRRVEESNLYVLPHASFRGWSPATEPHSPWRKVTTPR